ncbi:MAG: glycosyltransferase [Lachnospiraceae bacterium]|nr:glycosyltransferase [Lachnospiraceae bacterium]
MKIWVVGRGYPTPKNRMWGSFELEQAKMLQRNGQDVTYVAVTLSFLSRKDPRGLRKFEEDNVKIYAYSHIYLPGKLPFYLKGFETKCWRMVLEEVKKENGLPDVIHVHYPAMHGSDEVFEEFRKQGVKIVGTEHWTRVLKDTVTSFEKKRLAYFCEHANCLITVGNNLQDAIRKNYKVSVPVETVPNTVSPLFQPSGKGPSSKFTFAVSGRMVPHKRFDAVITQFLKTFPKDDNVALVLIGNGPEKEKLEKMSAQDPRITFTGIIPAKEVAKTVAATDALICYSSCETFAVPVIEAWASGKPVITLKSIPASVYCDETRGIVIDDKDQDDLGKAMTEIRKGYAKYDPEAISTYATQNFGDKAIANALLEIYEKY